MFAHHGAPHLTYEVPSWVWQQGAVGVSFFFVLSGFVLTWSRRETDSPRAFFRRRVARIYPVHVAALLVFIAASWRPLHHSPPSGWALVLPLFLAHAWVPVERIYFGSVSPSWSLSCELFFYALFPFIIGPLVRSRDAVRARLAAALVAGPLMLGLLVATQDATPFWHWLHYIFPPARLAEFALGILIALAVEREQWPRLELRGVVLLAVFAYVAAGFVPQGFMYVAMTLVPICLLIGTVAALDASGSPVRWLRQPWLIRLGTWSFAFYMLHTTVLGSAEAMTGRFGFTARTTTLEVALAFVGSVLFAGFMHHLVEVPFERRLRGAATA